MSNIEDILRDYHVPYKTEGQHHHAHHGWLQVDCPFCSPASGRYRMGYNLRGGYVNCWVCGKHGTVETLAALTGLPYKRCSELWGALAPVRLDEPVAKRGALKLPKGRGPLAPAHTRYLLQRGFEPEKLTKIWGIQGISLAARYAWRIFIPVYLNNRIVSFTTRSVSTDPDLKAKYMSAKPEEEEVSLKDLLYGEEYARHAIVINEGPLDVWAIGPGAVATCGLSYTQAQLVRMVKYPVRVVCFDNEPDAQRRAEHLAEQLSVFPGETYNVTLSGKDASRSPAREIARLRRKFLE